MEGVPVRLMVDPTAEPVAHHTPVPVPMASGRQERPRSGRHARRP